MSPRVLLRMACLLVASLTTAAAQIGAGLRIHVDKKLHPIDRRIYGQHIEYFGRIVQGGLSAELLRNREFWPIDPDRSNLADPWKAEADRSFVSHAIDRS